MHKHGCSFTTLLTPVFLLLFVIPKKMRSQRPAKVAGAVAGVALGTLDTAVGAVTAPAAKVKGAFTKKAAEEPETKDSDE